MATDVTPAGFEDISTDFYITFPSLSDSLFNGVTPREIILNESLLTPGLQTSVKLQTEAMNPRNWDALRGTPINIQIEKSGLAKFGYPTTMQLQQTVYRLGGRSSSNPNTTDNRKMLGKEVDEFVVHACDPTLLSDAETLVSKTWKCTTPSAIVSEMLPSCAGAQNLDIESCAPARDYKAENIHPFQVVNQQCSAALAGGNDPSFIHYMTYEKAESGQGTHHFRSLKSLISGGRITGKPLRYSSAGHSLSDPDSIMNYVFPCDFDLLSDILNGVNRQGASINSAAVFNLLNRTFSMFGNQTVGCGLGSGVFKVVMSNIGTADKQNGCPDYSYLYAERRQARMALLEKDKIGLRLVVPWNSIYHAGKVIEIELRDYTKKDEPILYGSGKYLIVSMTHTLRQGGYGITTLDCVSDTAAASGEV